MIVLGNSLGKSEGLRVQRKTLTFMTPYLVLCCITSNIPVSFSHPGWAKVMVKLWLQYDAPSEDMQ